MLQFVFKASKFAFWPFEEYYEGMFNIIILAVGKIKEKYFLEACLEYLKRLKPYAKISVHELRAESFGASDKARARKMEGERILEFIKKQPLSEVLVLDEHGQSFISIDFSKMLEKANRQVIFVIGGSLGLDKEVLNKPWSKISLSSLTFPHELARVVLLEQVYRAATIAKGKEYHY